jgi:hypothetical protein
LTLKVAISTSLSVRFRRRNKRGAILRNAAEEKTLLQYNPIPVVFEGLRVK